MPHLTVLSSNAQLPGDEPTTACEPLLEVQPSNSLRRCSTTLPEARIMHATAPHGRQARPGEARICTLTCVSHALCNAMERSRALRSTLEGGNLPHAKFVRQLRIIGEFFAIKIKPLKIQS
jgi:hypothetical protein